MSDDAGSDTPAGDDPRAPHWFDFRRINDLPNDWTFEVREWDDDPNTEGVTEHGEADVTRGEHRFTVTTWLEERPRTHDRYYSISYETVNQDGEPELLSFHIGKSPAIARNNLGQARDVVDGDDTTPHVVVRDHRDGPRETFEFPNELMAEKAADLQTQLKLDDDDRDYLVTVHSKSNWEDRLENERSVPGGTTHQIPREGETDDL